MEEENKITNGPGIIGGGIGNITSDVTVLIDEELSKKQYNLSFVANGKLYRNKSIILLPLI